MAFIGICTGFARDADYGVPYGVDVATHIIIACMRFRRGYRLGRPLCAAGGTRGRIVSLSLLQRYTASESEAVRCVSEPVPQSMNEL